MIARAVSAIPEGKNWRYEPEAGFSVQGLKLLVSSVSEMILARAVGQEAAENVPDFYGRSCRADARLH